MIRPRPRNKFWKFANKMSLQKKYALSEGRQQNREQGTLEHRGIKKKLQK